MRRALAASFLLVLLAGAAWLALAPAPPPPPGPPPPPPARQADEPGVGEVVIEWQTAFLEAIAESARDAQQEAAQAPAPAEPAPPPLPPAPPVADTSRPRRIHLRGDPRIPGTLVAPPPRGDLDRDTVKKAVAAVNPMLADCYRQGLRQDPALAGIVYVRFTIEQKDGEGRISDADLDPEQSTMTAPFVQACLLDALGKARFPTPATATGRQRVRYPFTLRTR